MRPREGERFFPKGYVLQNFPEQCTVLLSMPTGRPLLVDTSSFDYSRVLSDCLAVLPQGPSNAGMKCAWEGFISNRNSRRLRPSLLPCALLPRRELGVRPHYQREMLPCEPIPSVTQAQTIASSLNPKPDGQVGPAQERAEVRGRALLGRRVKKKFGSPWHSWFEGSVIAFLSTAETGRKSSLWRVQFDADGGVEEYTLAELNKILLPLSVPAMAHANPCSSSSSSSSSPSSSSSSSMPFSFGVWNDDSSSSDSNSESEDESQRGCRECRHGRKCRVHGKRQRT
jgi:hypothetical protein